MHARRLQPDRLEVRTVERTVNDELAKSARVLRMERGSVPDQINVAFVSASLKILCSCLRGLSGIARGRSVFDADFIDKQGMNRGVSCCLFKNHRVWPMRIERSYRRGSDSGQGNTNPRPFLCRKVPAKLADSS